MNFPFFSCEKFNPTGFYALQGLQRTQSKTICFVVLIKVNQWVSVIAEKHPNIQSVSFHKYVKT
jgi:hypothetical protein